MKTIEKKKIQNKFKCQIAVFISFVRLSMRFNRARTPELRTQENGLYYSTLAVKRLNDFQTKTRNYMYI